MPRIAKCVDEEVGEVSAKYSQWYKALEKAFGTITRKKRKLRMYVGGANVSEKNSIDCDTSLVPPLFDKEPSSDRVYEQEQADN